MKAILLIIFLFHLLAVNAQTNSKPTKKEKPSWSADMPERQKAPDVDLDSAMETNLDLDMGDFGMDRKAVIDSDDATDEADEQKKLAEQKRLEDIADAEEKQRQADITATEEKQRLADITATEEKQRLADIAAAEEKQRLADIAAAEEKQRLADIAAAEEKQELADIAEAERKSAEQKIVIEKAAEEERLLEQQRLADKIAEEDKQRVEDKAAAELVATSDDQQAIGKNDELNEVAIAKQEIQPSSVPQVYQWKKIKNVLPQYPVKAVRNNTEGWVEVEIIINMDGEVIETRLVKSYRNYKVFDKAAIKAVRQWKFDPPINYGFKTNQNKIVRIVFKL